MAKKLISEVLSEASKITKNTEPNMVKWLYVVMDLILGESNTTQSTKQVVKRTEIIQIWIGWKYLGYCIWSEMRSKKIYHIK